MAINGKSGINTLKYLKGEKQIKQIGRFREGIPEKEALNKVYEVKKFGTSAHIPVGSVLLGRFFKLIEVEKNETNKK